MHKMKHLSGVSRPILAGTNMQKSKPINFLHAKSYWVNYDRRIDLNP